MADVTQILNAIEEGDPQAAEKLLPLVYEELRKLARSKMDQESPDHTLQATALVHEAYIRLVGSKNGSEWDNRGHFFAAAAEAMRRILVDNARRKNRQKRGGNFEQKELFDVEQVDPSNYDQLLEIDQALEKLSKDDLQKAEIIKLRFFAGLTMEEISQVLGISVPTVKRQWRFARAWLHMELHCETDSNSSL